MSNNILSKDFSNFGLIKYTLPTIIMMIFMSTYTIVDGIFVSNFVNEDALSAVNIVFPVVLFATALGMMFSIGSNAVVAKMLGEGKGEEARGFFTMMYLLSIAVGGVATVLSLVFSENLVHFLGADEVIYPYAIDYLVFMSPFYISAFLQVYTQSFFITAGKPSLGSLSCLWGGLANIALDYLFIVELDMGIAGAALATGAGFSVPGLFGVFYFAFARKCDLHFVKPKLDIKLLLSSMYNGLSEFVGSIAAAVNMLLFNLILMDLAGSNGVASITVILYIQMIQIAVYNGFCYGIAPVISYKFGQQNHAQLKSISRVSIIFISIVSVFTITLSMIFAEFAVNIFIDRASPTFAMAVHGLRLFSIAYAFMGFNIFGSAMFTAYSNGKISAIISFCRTLVFFALGIIVLPMFLDINGVWLAVPFAELMTVALTIIFYIKHKQIYNY